MRGPKVSLLRDVRSLRVIKEYFIEKKVLIDWALDDRFLDSFGLGTPCLLSSFPHNKKDMLKSDLMKMLDNLVCADAKKTQIEVLLDELFEAVVVRDSVPITEGNWAELATLASEINAPACIITSENVTDREGWVCSSDRAKIRDILKQGKAAGYARPAKSSKEITGATKPLLQLSHRISIVDPYMWTPEGFITIKHFFKGIISNRLTTGDIKVRLIFSKKERNELTLSNIMTSLSTIFDEIIPDLKNHITVDIFLILKKFGGENPHNRRIITELGGVVYEKGIAEAKEVQLGNSNVKESMILMSEQMYNDEKNLYEYLEENFQIDDKKTVNLS